MFYVVKSSIKSGVCNLPEGPSITKKEHPVLFKFCIMMEIALVCLCLFAVAKISFDLLRML